MDIQDTLRRIGRQLREGTESQGREMSADLRDRGEDVRDELARLWRQVEELVDRRVVPTARSGWREARPYLREGGELAMDAAERLRGATRGHPLLAIGIAVATTWAVTSLLRTRR
jgi:hypothetical protein